MSDVLEFLKFFLEFDTSNLSVLHITIAGSVTIVMYFLLFFIRKYGKKQDITFVFMDFLVKCGIAFLVEFVIIWLYGSRITLLSIIVGILTGVYFRNKVFTFIDSSPSAQQDLKVRSELAELKEKFKKNPHYSILEVLLYYGYISKIQKEMVESANIFKTPDEMAKEFLIKTILTEEQLEEAIGIMNVIRREGKILTREEALLLIMNMGAEHTVRQHNDKDLLVSFVQEKGVFIPEESSDEDTGSGTNQDVDE